MVLLEISDKDLHIFVWKRGESQPLHYYRMTRVTFGVAASSYAANMAVKQYVAGHALEYPAAVGTVNTFYVKYGLTGADTH